jgi:zinc protease
MSVHCHNQQPLRIASLVTSALVLLASGQMITAQDASATERLDTKTQLKAVYFVPIAKSEQVHVQLIMNVGEADASGPEGIAHYVEHLVHWQSVGDINAKPIHYHTNAYTKVAITNFFASGRPGHLGRLLRQLSGVLDRPTHTHAFMLRERNVVVQEFMLRAKENVAHHLYYDIGRILYGPHALRRSVIGTPLSIRSIRPSTALQFFDKYYNATNATLVVTGKAERETVIKLVEEHFGRHRNGVPALHKWRSVTDWAPINKTVIRRYELAKREQVIVRQLFDVSALPKPVLLEALPLLRMILVSSLPGGLEIDLIYDNPIASQFSLRLRGVTDGWAEATFQAFPAGEIEPERVVEAYLAALRKLSQSGIEPATLKRAKRRETNHILRKRSSLRTRAGHATYWAANELMPPDIDEQLRNARGVKLAHLNKLVAAMAKSRRTVIGYALPEHKGN